MDIVKESLNEQIYKILKNDIINHQINFGEVLVNRNLQERFNVSSTPIRDALLRLKEDGIIDEITRSGARIIDFNPKFAREVNQFLMIITLGAVESPLFNDNRLLIVENLSKNIELQKLNIDTNLYYDYDYHFHKTIFDFSENALLKELFKKYNLISEILVRAYHKDNVSLDIRRSCIKDHEKILKSIEQNDLKATLSLIKKHYMTADEIFRKAR